MPQFCSVIAPFEEACAHHVVHSYLRSISPGIIHTELRPSDTMSIVRLIRRNARREHAPFDARQSASTRLGRRMRRTRGGTYGDHAAQ